MPLSVRLDRKTEQLVECLARERGQTKSEVVREAIAALTTRKGGPDGSKRPYDKVADMIGCVRGGPPDLSAQTGEKFRRLLATRKKT